MACRCMNLRLNTQHVWGISTSQRVTPEGPITKFRVVYRGVERLVGHGSHNQHCRSSQETFSHYTRGTLLLSFVIHWCVFRMDFLSHEFQGFG